MSDLIRFSIFIAAAFALFLGILYVVLGRQPVLPRLSALVWLSIIVVPESSFLAGCFLRAIPISSFHIFHGRFIAGFPH